MWLSAGSRPRFPGTELHGAAAAAEDRRVLMEATGTADLDELARMAMGRPAVGPSSGASTLLRAWVLKDRVDALLQRECRKEFDIVRAALATCGPVQGA